MQDRYVFLEKPLVVPPYLTLAVVLLPMIGMFANDRHRPVKLFSEHDAYQRMRHCHHGQRKNEIGAVFDFIIQAICAPDKEANVLAAWHPGFQPLGQLRCRHRFAAFVQDHFYTVGRDCRKNSIALGRASAGNLGGTGTLAVGRTDLDQQQGRFPRHAPGIVLKPAGDPGGRFVPDSNDEQLHGRDDSPSRSAGGGTACAVGNGSARGLPPGRLTAPQLFKIVIASNRGLHDVNDNGAEIHEHPFTGVFPLHA